jgi:hypothetical protein
MQQSAINLLLKVLTKQLNFAGVTTNGMPELFLPPPAIIDV